MPGKQRAARRDVRFGSLAVVHDSTTRMAAIERIPDARLRFPGSPYLTVRFHQERSFKTLSNQQNDRPLSAKSGHIDIHGQIGLGGLEVNCIAILLMAAFIESLRSTMSKKSIYVVGPDGRVRRGVLLQLGQCGIYLRYKASLVYSSPKGGCLLFKIGNHLLI